MTTIGAVSNTTTQAASVMAASSAASQASSTAATSTSSTTSPAVIVDISPAASAQASGTNSADSGLIVTYNQLVKGLSGIERTEADAAADGFNSLIQKELGPAGWAKSQANAAMLENDLTTVTGTMQTQAKAEFGNNIQFSSTGVASFVSTTNGAATNSAATSDAATTSDSNTVAAQAVKTLATTETAPNTTTQQQSSTDGSIALSLLTGRTNG